MLYLIRITQMKLILESDSIPFVVNLKIILNMLVPQIKKSLIKKTFPYKWVFIIKDTKQFFFKNYLTGR